MSSPDVPYKEINFEEVKELIDLPKHSYYLIDVREQEEVDRDGQMVHTTLNIPVNTLESALKMPEDDFKKKFGLCKPSKNSDIILTCRSGNRAKRAAATLLSCGYNSNTMVYTGSITDWKNKNGPMK
ncbi:TSTD3 (predicted) [Pycnogonum litorale]